MPGVSVILPVREAGEHFAAALRSITAQTLADLDIIITLNGSTPATRSEVHDHARGDSRIRILELAAPNLAHAINEGLRIARFDLAARMDGDDLSALDRLEKQAEWMAHRPRAVALGTAFGRIAPTGELLEEVHPPTDPRDLRWRLLTGNQFCHGSMMLRRSAVLGAGGYNPSCTRGQDYELWMRLSRTCDMANLSEVLYMHRVRDALATIRPDQFQAATDARILLHYWRALRPTDPKPAQAQLEPALARALADTEGPGPPIAALEQLMRQSGPTRDSLLAWMWAQLTHARRQIDQMRESRVRDLAATLRARGIHALHLWGAGEHTRWLLDRRDRLGIRILGIVDDHRYGSTIAGMTVAPPASLRPGDHALISSEMYERAIWASSAPHRARGITIWPLYEPSTINLEGAPPLSLAL